MEIVSTMHVNIEVHKYWVNQNTVIIVLVIILIIYMKKLLDSDWQRAVQFKCNTSAKRVTPVQKV